MALWTAKEAVLKATGHGLSVVPSLVRVQLTDALLDALELAMNEEVPGDLLGSDAPEPTALRVLTPVSYTHLDVYKRQERSSRAGLRLLRGLHLRYVRSS